MSYADISQILRLLARAIEHQSPEQSAHPLEHRRLVAIQRLLAGERVDASLLNYSLRGFHVGLAISSPDTGISLSDQRQRLNSRLLLVKADTETIWGWLGGDLRGLELDLEVLLAQEWPNGVAIACGEPAEALGGWCLTHRQALAALPIAQAGPAPAIHYRDVALLATALHDDLLSSSLRRSYLGPLEEERDGGVTAHTTLRAYFKATRNASSAAAALGVNRATVRNRLIAIEERLGRPLDTITTELELALQLKAFEEAYPLPIALAGPRNGQAKP